MYQQQIDTPEVIDGVAAKKSDNKNHWKRLFQSPKTN